MTTYAESVSDHEKTHKNFKTDIAPEEALISKRIQKLKGIIAEETTIRLHPSTYDEYYLRCLRVSGNDINRAAQLYIRFCQLRTGSTQGIIEISLPSLHMKNIYRNKLLSVLKSKDSSGRAVIILRCEKWDPKVVSTKEILAAIMMLLDEVLSSVDIQTNGIVFITDLKCFYLSHARLWCLEYVQILVKIFQDSYPAKVEGLHVVNSSMTSSILISLIKKLMTESIRNKYHIHGSNMASLHKFVHPDILPKYLGGKLSEDDFADTKVIDILERKDGFYKDFLKYGSQI